MSKNSFGCAFQIAKEKNISFEGVKAMHPDEVYRLLYPDKYAVETLFDDPNYEYVHTSSPSRSRTSTLGPAYLLRVWQPS